MSQHTPGPWRVGPYPGHVESMDGRLVAGCMGRQSAKDSDDTNAVNEANARLIAAAPELLEALEDVMERFGTQLRLQGYGREFKEEMLDKARAAIAQAKGEAS